jgi:hypothetical protein
MIPMLLMLLMRSRYWSAMTMSTVGYGKEPGSKEGQILCSVLSMVGAPIFVAVPAGIVSRAFPSCTRSILTEIYLCNACSYREIIITRSILTEIYLCRACDCHEI